MINTFQCKCGQESYSFQKLLDIPLLLPNDTIEMKSVKVNLKDECENCKKKEQILKKKYILIF